MKKFKIDKKNSKKIVILAIGAIILIVGSILALMRNNTLDGKVMALATVSDVERREISSSKGIMDVDIYHIQYETFENTIIEYTRQQELGENMERGTQFIIYYDLNDYHNVVEYTDRINISYLLILMGAIIIILEVFLMYKEDSANDDKKLSKKVKNVEEINFKINPSMQEKIENDIKKQEESKLIDDELFQIEEEENNKSLLQKRMENSNSNIVIYDENGNPQNVPFQPNGFNTGSIVAGMQVPSYGNHPMYGSSQSQPNYYGNPNPMNAPMNPPNGPNPYLGQGVQQNPNNQFYHRKPNQ